MILSDEKLIFDKYFAGQTNGNVNVAIIALPSRHTSFTRYFGFQQTDKLTLCMILGTHVIGWDETELCIPKKYDDSNLIVNVGTEPIHVLINPEMWKRISRVIATWNVHYSYYNGSKSKKNQGDSIGFIEALLHSQNIHSFRVSDPFQDFIRDTKHRGKYELSYRPSSIMIQKFEIDQKLIVFKSHSEFDVFVRSLFAIDMEFDLHYREEYVFLKCLDDTYWLKYKKLKTDHETRSTELMILLKNKLNKINLDDTTPRIRFLEREIHDLNAEITSNEPRQGVKCDELGTIFECVDCPFHPM